MNQKPNDGFPVHSSDASGDHVDQPTHGWGLLANGSSGPWDIAVDEALDRKELSLEIEGPRTYLSFQLQDLKVIEAALRFLESGPRSPNALARHDPSNNECSLTLGRFGSASVSLLWDNEDVARCFIVIGPKAKSTLRVSLEREDIQMFINALRQVLEDLPQAADK